MEPGIEKDRLLTILIDQARDVFISVEKRADLLKVLKESNSFNGKNHIFLLTCYFDENPTFIISKQEAINQAQLAIKEGSGIGYYYLYNLYKDDQPSQARNCLRLAVDIGYSIAILQLAKCYHFGQTFQKDEKLAEKYYKIACKLDEPDAYFYLLMLYCQQGDKQKAEELYIYGLSRGFDLPGIVE